MLWRKVPRNRFNCWNWKGLLAVVTPDHKQLLQNAANGPSLWSSLYTTKYKHTANPSKCSLPPKQGGGGPNTIPKSRGQLDPDYFPFPFAFFNSASNHSFTSLSATGSFSL